jgi:hypothetical protein
VDEPVGVSRAGRFGHGMYLPLGNDARSVAARARYAGDAATGASPPGRVVARPAVAGGASAWSDLVRGLVVVALLCDSSAMSRSLACSTGERAGGMVHVTEREVDAASVALAEIRPTYTADCS